MELNAKQVETSQHRKKNIYRKFYFQLLKEVETCQRKKKYFYAKFSFYLRELKNKRKLKLLNRKGRIFIQNLIPLLQKKINPALFFIFHVISKNFVVYIVFYEFWSWKTKCVEILQHLAQILQNHHNTFHQISFLIKALIIVCFSRISRSNEGRVSKSFFTRSLQKNRRCRGNVTKRAGTELRHNLSNAQYTPTFYAQVW